MAKECINCNKKLRSSWQVKYCSNNCQFDFQYNKYIKEWKAGRNDNRTINISKHLKKYLLKKFREKCSKCGWNEKHPITGHAPLDVDHIDGNADNNREENLTLLCPNCHALTSTYKNLNKGKGRKLRIKKIDK